VRWVGRKQNPSPPEIVLMRVASAFAPVVRAEDAFAVLRALFDRASRERTQEAIVQDICAGSDDPWAAVGWVEPFAKPVVFGKPSLMGIAALHPSYALNGSISA